MKELTRAEDQVMQILWELEKGFVKDIIAKMPAPKPAYNTVSTIIRILEKKGFVGHKAYGKTHEYFPLVPKDQYRSFFLKNFMGSYFGGSFERLVSFFAKDNNLDIQEIDQIMSHIKGGLEKTKDNNDG
ncbi:BlaI/MecI/CopY family transcriptional regulator [Xanthovirga aplysinae]|uniref:BlaI/MecI/CopY family transcriptional regulator n=1 Tax=Xanthovirga aplysinae TaxID=2529853 RepID=UPI0012BC418B|nr:BlaI/MecI/CopY family transcriptional regulator [Xanthovirga aplysinae]MTI31321.1 BlaI/MecI/CopY family transcriptional regulator [Xanthovirga aplysinae]